MKLAWSTPSGSYGTVGLRIWLGNLAFSSSMLNVSILQNTWWHPYCFSFMAQKRDGLVNQRHIAHVRVYIYQCPIPRFHDAWINHSARRLQPESVDSDGQQQLHTSNCKKRVGSFSGNMFASQPLLIPHVHGRLLPQVFPHSLPFNTSLLALAELFRQNLRCPIHTFQTRQHDCLFSMVASNGSWSSHQHHKQTKWTPLMDACLSEASAVHRPFVFLP